jgi:hypothetical protein
MPDWRNPDDYAYAEKLRLHDWAWEFLRRSHAYRLAWDRFLIAAAADKRVAYESASGEFGLVEPVDPDLSAAETGEVSWWEAVGVRILADWSPSTRENQPWPGFPRVIGLAFDFTVPLKLQIAQATDVLKRCLETLETIGFPMEEDPKPRVRVSRTRFTLYLRLLDAERAGASLGEMGRQLFKDHGDQRNSAKEALQNAKRMTESGYRDLLLRANL